MRHEKYDGKFICVVEGAVATKYNGGYGKVGGVPSWKSPRTFVPKAAATIATAAVPLSAVFRRLPPTRVDTRAWAMHRHQTPQFPVARPTPINLVGTVVNYLLLGQLPELDDMGRPCLPIGKTIHDKCPRRSHFENEEFVEEFGSEEAAMGYCLYKVGCRGPETYNNCPTAKFNDGTSWPVEAGHPCIGCSEPGFWDKMTPFYEECKAVLDQLIL
jgi:[NiFe] hydrogenase small subunit